MGQGPDARKADRKLAVVGVGETDASRLHEEAELLRIGWWLAREGCSSIGAGQRGRLVGRDNRLVQCPIRQAHTALVARGAVLP